MLDRKTLFTLLIVAAVSLTSCNSFKSKESVVIKDCTGAYLQIDGSDFRICNRGKVDHIENGTKVIADFRASKTCEADNEIVCMMYHEYEDDIRISRITIRE